MLTAAPEYRWTGGDDHLCGNGRSSRRGAEGLAGVGQGAPVGSPVKVASLHLPSQGLGSSALTDGQRRLHIARRSGGGQGTGSWPKATLLNTLMSMF